MKDIGFTILWGTIGSLLAAFVGYQFGLGRRLFSEVFRLPFILAIVLARGGIRRMTLSRADYRARVGSGVLRDYLATATNAIDIVSVSLNVTQAENSLISFFEQKINENENFCVRITLLNPLSPVIPILAKSLDLEPKELEDEIRDTLRQLERCKSKLVGNAIRRLMIYVHDTLPIGSAILLDATPETGRIQVETKLYRAPRTESFGFEVAGPSPFYKRNFTAWSKVFLDSNEWQEVLSLPIRSSPVLIGSGGVPRPDRDPAPRSGT
jgi:hypothetical protein